MFLYLRGNKVVMTSEERIEAQDLEEVVIKLPPDDLEKFQQNCPAVWDGKQLIFDPPTTLKSAEEVARKNLVEDVQLELAKLADAKVIKKEDLINIFNKLAV